MVFIGGEKVFAIGCVVKLAMTMDLVELVKLSTQLQHTRLVPFFKINFFEMFDTAVFQFLLSTLTVKYDEALSLTKLIYLLRRRWLSNWCRRRGR